jgi:bacteriocin biosynthesis cyclodehydratase domain-containing protein
LPSCRAMQLSLLPNLRQLWRDPRTVQLGTDPDRAVVLEFSDPVAARILDLLDGSRTESQVLADATSMLAVDVPETRAVLAVLTAAGLLIDAHALLPAGLPEHARRRLLPEATALAVDLDTPRMLSQDTIRALGFDAATPGHPEHPEHPEQPEPGIVVPGQRCTTPADALRRRAAAKILLIGAEALVAPVSVILAGAGIGHIDPTVDGGGRPAELRLAITDIAPEARVSAIRTGAATVVVLVGSRPPATSGGRWRRAAVLSAGIRDGVVFIGPLVRPGGSPCWHCLELHRNDRDPAWPVLAAQLATARPGTQSCALTTSIAGAAYAAEEVLSYVDGRQWRTDGAAVEIGRPGEVRRRTWSPHPRCGCLRKRPISPLPAVSG